MNVICAAISLFDIVKAAFTSRGKNLGLVGRSPLIIPSSELSGILADFGRLKVTVIKRMHW